MAVAGVSRGAASPLQKFFYNLLGRDKLEKRDFMEELLNFLHESSVATAAPLK